MEELGRHIPRIDNDDDDDDGYDTPAVTESWDDACNDYASFLEHKKNVGCRYDGTWDVSSTCGG